MRWVKGIVKRGSRHVGGRELQSMLSRGWNRWSPNEVLEIRIIHQLGTRDVSLAGKTEMKTWRIHDALELRALQPEISDVPAVPPTPQLDLGRAGESGWEVCSSKGQISSMTGKNDAR